MNNLVKLKNTMNKLSSGNKKFLKYGLPFIMTVVGGSFALKEFTQVRYKYYGQQEFRHEDIENAGIKIKPKGEVTLETEFEKVKGMDIDNWEQKRGPRPWE